MKMDKVIPTILPGSFVKYKGQGEKTAFFFYGPIPNYEGYGTIHWGTGCNIVRLDELTLISEVEMREWLNPPPTDTTPKPWWKRVFS